MVKSLGNEATSDQKLLILAKQAVEAERESNRRATIVKQNEKNLETVQREKENLQKEYNKGVLMRDKLEQVCREQQKLMKSIKSECTTRIREEEEKRKETQAHFQTSINEIFTTLGKNNEENAKLKDANLEMTKKYMTVLVLSCSVVLTYLSSFRQIQISGRTVQIARTATGQN